jgi:hypothetical protein
MDGVLRNRRNATGACGCISLMTVRTDHITSHRIDPFPHSHKKQTEWTIHNHSCAQRCAAVSVRSVRSVRGRAGRRRASPLRFDFHFAFDILLQHNQQTQHLLSLQHHTACNTQPQHITAEEWSGAEKGERRTREPRVACGVWWWCVRLYFGRSEFVCGGGFLFVFFIARSD